jgi:hypothetical protein
VSVEDATRLATFRSSNANLATSSFSNIIHTAACVPLVGIELDIVLLVNDAEGNERGLHLTRVRNINMNYEI